MRRTAFFVLLLSLFCGDVLALPDTEPVEIIRDAIIEKLLDGNGARLKRETPVDAAFIREIAPKRLRFNIVGSTSEVAGTEFEFESAEHDEHQGLSHVVVWVFSYRDDKSALRSAKSIRNLCRYGVCAFVSKIRTVFSYAVVKNRVVIVFTEKYVNENVPSFVESVLELFDK